MQTYTFCWNTPLFLRTHSIHPLWNWREKKMLPQNVFGLIAPMFRLLWYKILILHWKWRDIMKIMQIPFVRARRNCKNGNLFSYKHFCCIFNQLNLFLNCFTQIGPYHTEYAHSFWVLFNIQEKRIEQHSVTSMQKWKI